MYSWKFLSLSVWIVGSSLLAGKGVITQGFPGHSAYRYDCNGAVGPLHYAEISNLGFRVYDKSDGSVVYDSETLGNFWVDKAMVPSTHRGAFDPYLEYDHQSQRWFAMSLTHGRSIDSSVLLGISTSSDPSGTWNHLLIDADPDNLRWADFPYLGLDGAAVFLRLQMVGIDAGTEGTVDILTLPKSDLLQDSPTSENMTRITGSRFSFEAEPGMLAGILSPQIDYLGGSGDGLLVSPSNSVVNLDEGVFGIGAIFQTIMGLSGKNATTSKTDRAGLLVIDKNREITEDIYDNSGGLQPNTNTTLAQSLGNRNIRVGDHLYTVGLTDYSGLRGFYWLKLDVSKSEMVDGGFIGSSNHDHLDPSISANILGDVVIAFTRSSDEEYASLRCVVGQVDLSGKLNFSEPMLLKGGTEIYDENGPEWAPGIARYSDYSSSVTVDPNDPTHFWISGAYIEKRNEASTWISKIIVIDDTPVSVGKIEIMDDGLSPTLYFQSKQTQSYQLEGKNSLSDKEPWETIGLAIIGTGAEMSLTDNNGLLNSESRFYRIQVKW